MTNGTVDIPVSRDMHDSISSLYLIPQETNYLETSASQRLRAVVLHVSLLPVTDPSHLKIREADPFACPLDFPLCRVSSRVGSEPMPYQLSRDGVVAVVLREGRRFTPLARLVLSELGLIH